MRHGLISILTNPIYLGWWIPLDGGVIENNHEPIVEEALFTYAHRLLSTHDLNGERQRPERVTRSESVDALLKKVIRDPDGVPFYAKASTRSYACLEQKGRLVMAYKLAVSIEAIDAVFLEKFFERVRSIDPHQFDDFEDRIEQKRLAQEENAAHMRVSIKEAALKMQRINDLLTNTSLAEPLPRSMIDDLVKQYKGLEGKKRELERELEASQPETEKDEVTLYEIRTLIPRIVELWDELPFARRLRFVGALTRQVYLSRVSPGWVKMEIHWKMQGWQVDIAHIRRSWSGLRWTAEEEERLQKLFPTEDAGDILEALPTRSWRAIRARASLKHIARQRNGPNSIPVNSPVYLDMAFEDLQYVERMGLVLTTKNAQWSN